MISDESLAILRKIISVGNTCSVVPIKWNSTQNGLVGNRTWRHRLFSLIAVLVYCFLVGYSAFNYTVKSQSDLIVVLFTWAILTGTFFILFWLNWNRTIFVSVINGALCLNSVQNELFQEDKTTKDGLTVYLNCVWRLTQLIWMILPFHFYVFIETETSIGEVWRFESIFLKFAGIAGITFTFSMSTLGAAIIISYILLYINITSKWLKKLSRNYGGFKKKDQLKLIYRSYTLLHLKAREMCNELLPLLLSLAYVAIIASYFITFRIDTPIFCVIVFVIGSALSGVLNISFTLTYNITKYSAQFLHNFDIHTNNRGRGRDAAEDRRFFKSCQPLRTYIGEYSLVTRNFFPSVMHEIIISSTINLLLTIPS